MPRRLFAVVPLLSVMGLLFFLSHHPGDAFSLPDIVNLDKLLHCLAYGVLAATALFAVDPDYRCRRPLASCIGVVLFCLLYGISDEIHQSFIPGRMPSCWDILADVIGALLTVTLWFNQRRRFARIAL